MARKTSKDTWYTGRWNVWLPKRVQRLLRQIRRHTQRDPPAEIEWLVENEARRCARKRKQESKRD